MPTLKLIQHSSDGTVFVKLSDLAKFCKISPSALLNWLKITNSPFNLLTFKDGTEEIFEAVASEMIAFKAIATYAYEVFSQYNQETINAKEVTDFLIKIANGNIN